MRALLLILHLLPYAPAMNQRPPVLVAAPSGGSGLLLLVNCRPGSLVAVEPGHLRGAVGEDGVARISARAQAEGSDPYRVHAGASVFDLNGTLDAGQMLTGVCP